MADLILILLAIGACLLLSFFFSGAETAVISASRYRLRHRHEEGDETAGKTLELLSNTHRLLSALLIGNNLVTVLAVLFFKLFLDERWPAWSQRRVLGPLRWDEAVGMVVITPIIVIFAEVFPKALFRAQADSWISPLRPILRLIVTPLTPIVALLDSLVRGALFMLGGERDYDGGMTRGDVIAMLEPRWKQEEPETENNTEATAPDPTTEPSAQPTTETIATPQEGDERLLIKNIIRLEKRQVGEIMQPLIGLEAVHLGHVTMEGFLDMARRSGYSRFPAYRYRVVNLIGYIDVYDVIRDAGKRPNLEDFVRPAHYVPETKRVDDLLQEFLHLRLNNAVVVDESGGCCGWVTREDILEEIVGELADELDQPTSPIQEQTDGSYLIEGRTPPEKVNEALGTNFGDADCDTLGGIVMKEMGRIPKPGDEITIHGWKLKVEDMDGMRVSLIRVRLPSLPT